MMGPGSHPPVKYVVGAGSHQPKESTELRRKSAAPPTKTKAENGKLCMYARNLMKFRIDSDRQQREAMVVRKRRSMTESQREPAMRAKRETML